VNYQTLRDVDSYEWIVRNSRLSSEKTGASLTQAMTVLDELRPHLRRVGIFDASTMEQHADAVAKAVEAALITWPKKSRAEVLTQCAQHVARVAFAPPAAAAEVVQSKPRIVEQQQDRSRGEERSGPSGGRGR
jgi:hypothetical protein